MFAYLSDSETDDSLFFFLFCFVFKVQKQNYRQEKKRAAKELSSALKDPSVVIMSNWLKVFKRFLIAKTYKQFYVHFCF